MNFKNVKLFICTLLLSMAFVSTNPVVASETPLTNTGTEEPSLETDTPEKIIPYCILEDPS